MKTLILSIWMLFPNWEMDHEVTSVTQCPSNAEIQAEFKQLEEANKIVAWHAICEEVIAMPESTDKSS